MTEGSQVVKYTVSDPKQFGTFEPVSELILNDGELCTYANIEN